MYKVPKRGISIFEKYNDYDKNIILLAVNTLSMQDKILLKKKYGEKFLGYGYILKNEEYNYEMAEKRLNNRLIEIKDMKEIGKTDDEISNYYKEKSPSLYRTYTSPNQKLQVNKLGISFIENFPVQYRNIITNLLTDLSNEQKKNN